MNFRGWLNIARRYPREAYFRTFATTPQRPREALLNHPFVIGDATNKMVKKASFTNFQTLVEVLKRRIHPIERYVDVHSPEHIEEIRELLSAVQINPKEWKNYTHFERGRYTRTLVGFDNHFVALLLCWGKGQQSPIHDHAGASCWVKMLAGDLEEVLYDRDNDGKLVKVKRTLFSAGTDDDVSYMNDTKGLHTITNPSSTDVAVSLHIYSPPFRECNIFQPISGEPKTVSMVPSGTPNFKDQGWLSCDSDSNPADKHNPLFNPPALRGDSLCEDAANSSLGELTIQDFINALQEMQLSFPSSAKSAHNAKSLGDNSEMMDCVAGLMKKVQLSQDEWTRYCSPSHFSEFNYTRNLVYITPQFSLMILCWAPGQQTPPHSHGAGRKAWVKVLHGALTLDALGDDGSTRGTWDLSPDSAVMQEDETLLEHQLRNASDVTNAVSLHLYSPPLKELECKDKKTGGSNTRPVVCYSLDHCSNAKDGRMQLPQTQGVGSGTSTITPSLQGVTSGLRGTVFTNLDSFARLCDLEFEQAFAEHSHLFQGERSKNRARLDALGRRTGTAGRHSEEDLEGVLQASGLEERVTQMLRNMAFNPLEWQQYAQWDHEHFTRVLLASSPYYSLVLSCWDRGQFSPAHDHAGSRNWIKVLEGNIDEFQYERTSRDVEKSFPLMASRSGILAADSVTYLGPSTIHSCLNDHDAPAFTLHLYSPPYTRTHYFDIATGEKHAIDIPLFDGDALFDK